MYLASAWLMKGYNEHNSPKRLSTYELPTYIWVQFACFLSQPEYQRASKEEKKGEKENLEVCSVCNLNKVNWMTANRKRGEKSTTNFISDTPNAFFFRLPFCILSIRDIFMDHTNMRSTKCEPPRWKKRLLVPNEERKKLP